MTQLALLFLFICLILSLLINVRLLRDARSFFGWFRTAQLWPAVGSTLPPPTSNNKPILCFYGDSRLVDWPDPQLAEYVFLNHGINGETSNQTVARLPQTLAHKPAIMLIQIGINDLSSIAYLPKERTIIIENLQNNLQTLVSEISKTNTKVILATLFPFGSPNRADRLYGGKSDNPAITQINTFIHTLASDTVHIFDAAQLLSDENGNLLPKYNHDLLHINQMAYNVLNEQLKKVIS